MRAAPAFQVTLRTFGAWRAAVWTLAVLAWAVLTAWTGARDGRVEPIVTVPLALAVGLLAASLARCPARTLRWDGQCWWLDAAPPGPAAGRLTVALDLGGWMLLRFVPDAAPRHRRPTWVPAQRRGHEDHWHALRCTVHAAARPAAATPTARES